MDEVVIHLLVKGDGSYYPVGGETLTALFEIRVRVCHRLHVQHR